MFDESEESETLQKKIESLKASGSLITVKKPTVNPFSGKNDQQTG